MNDQENNVLRSRSPQNMDAKEWPVLEVKRSASPLEELLIELGLVSAIDVFNREPLVLALCKARWHRGGV